MDIIITPDRIKEHKVARYSFKNFDNLVVTNEPKPIDLIEKQQPVETAQKDELLEAIKARQAEDGGMVADLVKKVEEFGGSVIKLQMQLESQEREFKARLEEEKKRAYEDGLKAGEKGVENRLVDEIEAHKAQMIDSITKLDSQIEKVGSYAASLEKELSSIAVEIASEVIAKEVREDGAKVAELLAKELLKEVKEANAITIKIHPELASDLSKKFASESNIKVVADRAVAYGGVVLLSDAGNIDAQIQNRFLAVKNGILAGGAE